MDKPPPISRNFTRAANRYDHHALLQQQVADKLAKRLQHVALPFAPRILEIGAGTGNLSRKLQNFWPHAQFVITDISEGMIRTARQYDTRYRDRSYYLVMDAETVSFNPCFDLIVSSMSLHWVDEPLKVIERLKTFLNPGGVLAFSILTKDSFKPWRTACDKLNLSCGLWNYPSFVDIKASNGMAAVEETIKFFFESAEDFMRNLKAIGAATPRQGYKQQTGRDLRQLLRLANEMKPFVVNYDVAYAAYHAAKDVELFTNI
jgi:malonyl-CoA O-methyltransferase